MNTSVSALHLISIFVDSLHTAIPQFSGHLVGSLPIPLFAIWGFVFIAMTFIGIALPAVWSRRAERRKAAAEVLDRILRFLRPRS